PRVAVLLLGFVPLAEVLAVTEAVTDVYCEHGFRSRPARARLKFLLEEWGADRFAAAVLDRLRTLRPDARSRREAGSPVVGADRRSQAELRAIYPQATPDHVCVEARVQLGDLSGDQLR